MTGKGQAFLWSEGGVTEQAAVKSKRREIRPPAYTERIATKRREERTADNYGEERRHVYYYHGDHLGSAQVVTDYRGEVYEHIEYTPYGELWVEHAPNVEATPFRFTGKEWDSETGLYYYGARYLNPQTGMWLSTDPAMGEYIPLAPVNDEAKRYNGNLPGMGGVFNTVNLHAYHYAGNNPVKYTDPNGRTDIDHASKTIYADLTNRRDLEEAQRYLAGYEQYGYNVVAKDGRGNQIQFNKAGSMNTFLDDNPSDINFSSLEATINLAGTVVSLAYLTKYASEGADAAKGLGNIATGINAVVAVVDAVQVAQNPNFDTGSDLLFTLVGFAGPQGTAISIGLTYSKQGIVGLAAMLAKFTLAYEKFYINRWSRAMFGIDIKR
jgi:RHS repeat-associated protein